jgi:hypothetical protein
VGYSELVLRRYAVERIRVSDGERKLLATVSRYTIIRPVLTHRAVGHQPTPLAARPWRSGNSSLRLV